MRAMCPLLSLAIADQPSTSSSSVGPAPLTGCPGVQPGNPGTHAASVLLIVGSELAGQGGFLIDAHRGRSDTPGHRGVLHEAARAEQQHLAHQDRQEADVDRIAYVAVAVSYT